MAGNGVEAGIEAVRRFNRFYTQKIGVLQEGLLQSEFSLTESRVLYELAHRDAVTATELTKELGLDPGYLSRILRGFSEKGLVDRIPSAVDGRQSLISITSAGRKAFGPLDAGSRREIGAMLAALPVGRQERLVEAMATIENLLRDDRESAAYSLRPHQPGDMGWVVRAHGLLYAAEYGWNQEFEGLVAEIVAEFIRNFDGARERCWIAEIDGEIVGSVFLVRKTVETAKLRLLIVDPRARGLGIGKRLVDECLNFARQAGYREVTLWTNSVLSAARRIYQAAGFRLVEAEPHHSFGHDLVGETWVRSL